MSKINFVLEIPAGFYTEEETTWSSSTTKKFLFNYITDDGDTHFALSGTYNNGNYIIKRRTDILYSNYINTLEQKETYKINQMITITNENKANKVFFSKKR